MGYSSLNNFFSFFFSTFQFVNFFFQFFNFFFQLFNFFQIVLCQFFNFEKKGSYIKVVISVVHSKQVVGKETFSGKWDSSMNNFFSFFQLFNLSTFCFNFSTFFFNFSTFSNLLCQLFYFEKRGSYIKAVINVVHSKQVVGKETFSGQWDSSLNNFFFFFQLFNLSTFSFNFSTFSFNFSTFSFNFSTLSFNFTTFSIFFVNFSTLKRGGTASN